VGIPKRIGRIRQRQDEEDEHWLRRYTAEKSIRDAREARKKQELRLKALQARKASTLEWAKDVLGLDTEGMLNLVEQVDIPSEVGDLPLRVWSVAGPPWARDGLAGLRLRMTLWIEDTATRRLSEARCPLACMSCPSAQALLCAAHNDGVADEDGYAVEARTPTKEMT